MQSSNSTVLPLPVGAETTMFTSERKHTGKHSLCKELKYLRRSQNRTLLRVPSQVYHATEQFKFRPAIFRHDLKLLLAHQFSLMPYEVTQNLEVVLNSIWVFAHPNQTRLCRTTCTKQTQPRGLMGVCVGQART